MDLRLLRTNGCGGPPSPEQFGPTRFSHGLGIFQRRWRWAGLRGGSRSILGAICSPRLRGREWPLRAPCRGGPATQHRDALFLFGAFWTPLPRAPQNSGPGVQVTCLCHGQNACSACGLPAFLFSQVMFIYSAILEPSKAICLILLGINCKQTLGLGSFLVI